MTEFEKDHGSIGANEAPGEVTHGGEPVDTPGNVDEGTAGSVPPGSPFSETVNGPAPREERANGLTAGEFLEQKKQWEAQQPASAQTPVGARSGGPYTPSPVPPKKQTLQYVLLFAILGLLLIIVFALGRINSRIDGISGGYFGYYGEGYASAEATPVVLPPLVTPGPQGRELPVIGAQGEAAAIAPDNPTADIAQSLSPAIVAVLSKVTYTRFDKTEEYLYSDGSGIVLSSDGYIVTNYHVIESANVLYVVLDDSDEEIPADLIGYDDVRDIAVLKIDRYNLHAARFGDSDALRVGDLAVAIGNPLGTLTGTVTQGIISAAHRTLELENGRTQGFIQTDAAINPGNSGGALANKAGEVVGINTLKEIYAGYDEYGMPIAAEGIGYAIPINDVLPIVQELILTGRVKRPGLGITGAAVTPELARENGCPPGVYVDSVVEGGPADRAGIAEGDVITAINGEPVDTMYDLTTVLDGSQVGETVELKVWQAGQLGDPEDEEERETFLVRLEDMNQAE